MSARMWRHRSPHTVGGKVKRGVYFDKQLGSSSKMLNLRVTSGEEFHPYERGKHRATQKLVQGQSKQCCQYRSGKRKHPRHGTATRW